MEILQNTIMKLVFRIGSDTDRKKVRFTTGEPVFTTDTNRLFIGNGVLSGGQLVGNLFQGVSPDLSNLSPGEIGDFGYNNDKQELCVITQNDGSSLTDWLIAAKPNSLLFARYNGSLSAMETSKGVTGTNLSAGHYRFTYTAFPSISSYTPTTQIFGSTPANSEARVSSMTLSSCDVVVLSSNVKVDAIVSLVLNY